MARLIIICLIAITASVSAVFNEGDFVIGKKLKGYTFHTKKEVSAEQCLKECGSRPTCASFNYIRRFHLCELNTHKKADTQLEDARGYVFKEMQVSFFKGYNFFVHVSKPLFVLDDLVSLPYLVVMFLLSTQLYIHKETTSPNCSYFGVSVKVKLSFCFLCLCVCARVRVCLRF